MSVCLHVRLLLSFMRPVQKISNLMIGIKLVQNTKFETVYVSIYVKMNRIALIY